MKLTMLGITLTSLLAVACSSSHNASDETVQQVSCIPANQLSGIVGGSSLTDTSPLAKKVVMLLMNDNEACTATPISDTVLLTAAHCMENVTAANQIRVVFHSTLTCESGFDAQSQSTKASAFVVHSGYVQKTSAIDDLALVKLSSPIPASYQVSSLYDGHSKLSSDTVTFVGYGRTGESNQDSLYLRTVTKSYKHDLVSTNAINITFDQSNGQGVCNGDSGGPIFIEANGEQQIIGVISIIAGTSESTLCHGRNRAMYAPGYAKWIQDHMAALN